MRAPRKSALNKPSEKTLRPIRANLGIEAAYRQKLTKLIEDLHRSTVFWVKATYRKTPPRLAQDESAAAAMRRVMRELSKRWLSAFDDAATKLAEYFAKSVSQRSDAALKKILKDGGFAIEFEMTPAQREVFQATVEQNVALIKSIPQQYLGRVEQMVMQSVQSGGDLGRLSSDLEKQFGVTKRRAAFIAKHQNMSATGALNKARYVELGIDTVQWCHSHGGKTQRRTHIKASNDKVTYDPAVGWYDPDEGRNIYPGELPNCRCYAKIVLKKSL